MALLLSVAVLPGAFHVSAANEFPTVKSEITLTDTDPDNEGTMAKHDLLADPEEGLVMENGETYVFEMNILANSYNESQGGTAKPFGFDLLGNPTKQGGEIKLSGVEFPIKMSSIGLTPVLGMHILIVLRRLPCGAAAPIITASP